MSGKLKNEYFCKDDKIHGNFLENFPNGIIRSKGKVKKGKMDGKWTFWYHNGQKECEVICKNGELIDGKVWDDDGNKKESLRFNLTWEGSAELQDI